MIIDREVPSKTLNQFNDENQIHIVEKGNTLYYISQKYNTTVEELQRLNNLKGTEVSIGQKIKVSAQQEVAQKSINHTVEQGETLYSISRKYNTTVQSLQQLNGLSDNTISIGQTLLISKN
jgi:LysM repeat protein